MFYHNYRGVERKGLNGIVSRGYRCRRGGRSRGGGGGGGGWGGWLTGLIIVLFLVFIALNFVSTFQGSIGNLTYSGGGVGATIFSLVQTWIIPLALIGLLVYGLRHFLGGGGKR